MHRSRGVALIILLLLLLILFVASLTSVLLLRLNREWSRDWIDRSHARLAAGSGLEYALARLSERDASFVTFSFSDPDEEDWRSKSPPETPIERMERPSYHRGDRFSGGLRGIHAPRGTRFRLKIVDASARVPLNVSDEGNARLLDRLGEELGLRFESGGLADRVRGLLPLTRYTPLRRSIGDRDFDRLRPHVTLWGDPDPSVLLPDPVDVPPGEWIFHRADHRRHAFERDPRSPVNVNLAGKPVLVSLFSGLTAKWVEPVCRFDMEEAKRHQAGRVKAAGIGEGVPALLADRILEYRRTGEPYSDIDGDGAWGPGEPFTDENGNGRRDSESPFRNWREFFTFLKGLEQEGELSETDVALIAANADPNASLAAHPRDLLKPSLFDKSDLTAWTAELTFEPSGIVEIESLGIVTNLSGRHLAESRGFWNGRVHRLWRETTQADFADGTISTHTGRFLPETFRDRTLQRYPEPEVPGVEPNRFDGYLMPATYRTESIRPGETSPDLLFYAPYEQGLDGEYSRDGGDTVRQPYDNASGTLLPDGVYAEERSLPAYAARRNLNNARGTVSFWFRYSGGSHPSWPPTHHVLFSATRHPDRWSGKSRRFQVGIENGKRLGFHMETDDETRMYTDEEGDRIRENYENRGGERIRTADAGELPSGWSHLAAAWDGNRPGAVKTMELYLNGERQSGVHRTGYERPVPTPFAADFTSEEGMGRGRMRLGEISQAGWQFWFQNGPACSLIDEFALFDAPKSVEEVRRVWEDGRYYNGNEGGFESAPREFPEGTRFLSVSWTARFPEGMEPQEEGGWRVMVDFHDGAGWRWDRDGDGDLSQAEERQAALLSSEGRTTIDPRPLVPSLVQFSADSSSSASVSMRTSAADMGGALETREGVRSVPLLYRPVAKYRVFFRTDADPHENPLYTAPIFDDVTIRYCLPSGPEVFSWFLE